MPAHASIRRLAPRNDVSALRSAFAGRGSVSIPCLLPQQAANALAGELRGSSDWLEILRAGNQAYEMPTAALDELNAERRNTLTAMIHSAARESFQHRYRAIRVSEDAEERAARGTLLDGFVDLLNKSSVMDLLRDITGLAGIGFADGQATDYRAGDFLTTHDDAVEGKNRLAAYVFGLTETWQADWGGLLLLERGLTVDGFVPAFNELRIFRVPQTHHVSIVAPWVERRRLSITGWLRSSGDHTGS